MKTLCVTLADILGPTGTPNSTATVSGTRYAKGMTN